MNTITKYWFLEGFNIFNKLGRLTMMRMCETLEMDQINKATVIQLLNKNKNSIFFLKKGTVKIVNSTTNDIKYIVKKGNLFGELSLYDERVAVEEHAIALEDCIICYIEATEMERLMEKHESLKNGVLKIYGLRIKRLERRLQDLLYKDSLTRITEFITDYIKEFGKVENGLLVANNILSHKDISNLTNTSRQTTSNVLSKLRKKGIIDYSSRYISMPFKEEFIEREF